MVCIYCSGPTKVTNSRPQKRLRQTWRRRQCTKCGAIFSTTEAVDLHSSLVVRHADGHIAPFSRDILFASILQAVGHRTAPISDAGALTATIIAKLLRNATTAAVTPSAIAAVAFTVLKNFDAAAAVQYRAYHKS